jgi:serine/threonine protein kinase
MESSGLNTDIAHESADRDYYNAMRGAFVEESPDQFGDLLLWVLEVPPGEPRRKRAEEAANGDPQLKARFETYLGALEKRSWLETPEQWVLESASTTITDRTGQRYGAWQIVESVGGGGSGEVYEAVRIVQGARLRGALKVLFRRVHTEADRDSFKRELLALSQVEGHPNVIRLLDGDVTPDGECYLVTELVEGCSLAEWAEQQRLDVPARVLLFCQVLDALNWVHGRQRVHRDVKPTNLLVSGGHVKLLDFGLAITLDDSTLTRTRSLMPVKVWRGIAFWTCSTS